MSNADKAIENLADAIKELVKISNMHTTQLAKLNMKIGQQQTEIKNLRAHINEMSRRIR